MQGIRLFWDVAVLEVRRGAKQTDDAADADAYAVGVDFGEKEGLALSRAVRRLQLTLVR